MQLRVCMHPWLMHLVRARKRMVNGADVNPYQEEPVETFIRDVWPEISREIREWVECIVVSL